MLRTQVENALSIRTLRPRHRADQALQGSTMLLATHQRQDIARWALAHQPAS